MTSVYSNHSFLLIKDNARASHASVRRANMRVTQLLKADRSKGCSYLDIVCQCHLKSSFNSLKVELNRIDFDDVSKRLQFVSNRLVSKRLCIETTELRIHLLLVLNAKYSFICAERLFNKITVHSLTPY